MRKLFYFGYLILLAAAPVFAEPSRTNQREEHAENVLGIGGLFFLAQNPKALAEWYQDNLGVSLVPENYDQSPWKQGWSNDIRAFPKLWEPKIEVKGNK